MSPRTNKPKPRRLKPRIARFEPVDAIGAVVAPIAFNHLAEALSVYLKAMGWTALVVGQPEIRYVGYTKVGDPAPRVGNFEFAVRFTGGKRTS